MKLYERCAKAIAAVLLGFLVLLVAELIRVQPGAKNIHTQEESLKSTQWENAIRLEEETELATQTISVEQVEEAYHLAPRVIRQESIQKVRLVVSDAEREILYRIVQAEAGGEDELGKKMVADVIVNRVKNDKFPDTVEEVVFQNNGGKAQFAPTVDGRYNTVTVPQETKDAVDEALLEEDHTAGALYFVASAKAASDKVSWFESHLTCKGTHGGHTFYQ